MPGVARLRSIPRVAWAYAALQLAVTPYRVSSGERPLHHSGTAKTALVLAIILGLSLLVIAGVVVWRQRWLWVLLVFAGVIGVVEPAWHWHGVVTYLIGLAALALLLSPSMRRYVGVRRPHPRPA